MIRAPVIVVNQNTKRETGRRAQIANITAAKDVSSIIRSSLGPRAMLKMILSQMGGILLTNDGNAILREIDVNHPGARSMLELSRTQDEEVGDGTTSVIILAAEFLSAMQPLLERNYHPIVLTSALQRALADALEVCNRICKPVNPNDPQEMLNVIRTCLGSKFAGNWMDHMCSLALQAVRTVARDLGSGKKEIDLKRYAKVEKIPGGSVEDSCVLDGVMFNKDILHQRMRRRIENPKILLLDCSIEYKKLESNTQVTLEKESDFEAVLREEEEAIRRMCEQIVALHPDIVVTEKGLSDLAAHYFVRAGISALRRLRKTDNNRLARACGATICHRVEEIKESDLGTGCGLFEVRKIGDEYFSFFVQCNNPKACTIMLRGASRDVLDELERNLQDAMFVARNLYTDPRLLPGGGATEMAVSAALVAKSKTIEGIVQAPYRAIAEAFEIIPTILAENCGVSVIRTVTQLRAKHHEEGVPPTFGINGLTGEVANMEDTNIFEPMVVKTHTFKTAIESASMIVRIDEIVSGVSKKKDGETPGTTSGGAPDEMD